ncbi:MAG: GNAT family N-acetyltransferase [Beijerinckiaceae bacterium]
MNAISLRVTTTDDAASVSAVLAASYPALLASAYDPDVLGRALPLMTKANPKLLASGTYYLAEAVAGVAVGCGGWTRERPGSGEIENGLGHIRHFGVRPDWSGRGVGRTLLERCIREARAAGVAEFEAYSTLNGEPFYAALGFEPIGRFDVAMGPGASLPSVIMRRALAD